MQYVSLKLLTEDVPLAAAVLANYGLFNPEATEAVAEQLPTRFGEDFRNLFNQARSRLDKILARISFAPPPDTDSYRVIDLMELKKVNNQLGKIWLQLSKLEEQLHHFNEQGIALQQLLETLQTFVSLDLDLKCFQEPKQFLNLHIGTVPVENLEHLIDAIAIAEHFIDIFHRDEHTAYFVVAGPLDHQDKVHAILEHADFQALIIPTQFHNHPQQVHADLTAQLAQLQEQTDAVTATIKELTEEKRLF